MCSIAPYEKGAGNVLNRPLREFKNFVAHTINRRAQKKSPPDHGKALRFLFSLLRGLRRAVCGLVSAIAAAARALQPQSKRTMPALRL